MRAQELTRLRRVPNSGRRKILASGSAVALLTALSAASLPARASAQTFRSVASAPTTGFPTGYVNIDGHGWGPGIGMGQWGAFGYAAVGHMTYRWIVSHFYGGTVLSQTADPMISVSIIGNEDVPVTVTSRSRFRFGGLRFAAGTAGRAVMDPKTGKWTLSSASSCTAKSTAWKVRQTGLTNPLAVPYSQKSGAAAATLLTICRADGTDETVRGLVQAYNYDNANTDNKPLARTINRLPLDSYVADVVPSESSSGWGQVGGVNPSDGQQWGFQSLEAQAVAARTYALAYKAAGGWYGYADICDVDYCQSYPGIANESKLGTLASTDTAGKYLTVRGAPAATQYSASTGGWTDKSSFPAVVDSGDSVCLTSPYWTCNPVHSWKRSIPVKTVQATFPSIGTLQSITATSRNGDGSWGGRVLTVKIAGSKGAVSESGDTFQGQFGLDSNWFLITHPKTSAAAAAPSASVFGTALRSPTGGAGTGPLPVNGKTPWRVS